VTGVVAQALFNISVVLALVPTKGIPLPFISYGGSSLVPTLFAVGVLLNISQHANVRAGLGSAEAARGAGAGQGLEGKRLRTAYLKTSALLCASAALWQITR
ncbi:MAG TPA: FtsW/RodA/SpoVE family cell cycle protein, partial [Pyrinomonadaceae bacterium]